MNYGSVTRRHQELFPRILDAVCFEAHRVGMDENHRRRKGGDVHTIPDIWGKKPKTFWYVRLHFPVRFQSSIEIVDVVITSLKGEFPASSSFSLKDTE